MNTEQTGKSVSIPAGSDLSATPYRFVTTSSGALALCGAGLSAIGVLTNEPKSGQPGSVTLDGIVMVDVGGSVTADDIVKSDASGKAVTASGADISAGMGLGRALGTASTGRIPVVLNERGIVALSTGSESISSAGAVSTLTEGTYLTVANTVAYTFGDGKYVGQKKWIECLAVSGTPLGTVTVNDMYGSEPVAWVFTTPGQRLELVWTATGWKVFAIRQIGKEVVANAGTANPLCLHHSVAIADTVDFLQGAGLVAGQRAIWFASANSGTPAGTVSGLFYDEDGSADGIDVNMNAAGDLAVLSWDGLRWFPESLVSTTIST